jgi:hypothetical protein
MKLIFAAMAMLLTISSDLLAQEASNHKALPYFTASIHSGSIYAHTQEVHNIKGAYPIGIELLFTKQNRDEKNWQQYNCYFNSGVGINYIDYNTDVLGKGFALFYVFEPQFKLGKLLKALGSTHLGLTYLSNPYSKNVNSKNLNYSLPLSAYISLGMGIEYPLNKNWQMSLLGQFIHISNGGTQEPNKGINLPTLNMRFSYNPISNGLNKYEKKPIKLERKTRIDIGLYGSNKNLGVNDLDRYFIFGALANYSKQISNINAITGGIEILTDQVTEARLQRDKADKSNVRAGLLIGHEFLFGRFAVSQQLGCYLVNETNYFNALYQRAGVTYYTPSKIAIGFNILTHTIVPNFLDLRVMYYFNK